jgi:hypothetical protein
MAEGTGADALKPLQRDQQCQFCSRTLLSHRVPKFHPMAQCVVHALKGLACRARVTPASSPASHCSALTSPSLHAHAAVTKSIVFFQWVQNLGTLRSQQPSPIRFSTFCCWFCVRPAPSCSVLAQFSWPLKWHHCWILCVLWFV